jgi:hypothetical protein
VNKIAGLGMVEAKLRFSDYRDIGGVQIPFKVMTKYSTPVVVLTNNCVLTENVALINSRGYVLKPWVLF